jgi:hypothetical protein
MTRQGERRADSCYWEIGRHPGPLMVLVASPGPWSNGHGSGRLTGCARSRGRLGALMRGNPEIPRGEPLISECAVLTGYGVRDLVVRKVHALFIVCRGMPRPACLAALAPTSQCREPSKLTDVKLDRGWRRAKPGKAYAANKPASPFGGTIDGTGVSA